MTPSHPFRFGLIAWEASSRVEWQDLARQAEDLGFATLVVPDHLGAHLAPLPAALSAADATTSLRVGTLVVNADLRRAEELAFEAAAVDLLADGRLELGLGAGGQPKDYEPFGLALEPAAVRVGRLERAVEVVQALPGGGPTLLVGGNGRATLELGARRADVVQLSGLRRPGAVDASFTRAGAEERAGWVRAAAGGRSPELSALVQSVTATLDPVRASGLGLSDEDLLASPHLLVGPTEQLVEVLLERREALGISYITVFAAMGGLKRLPPVVAELAGR